MRTIRRSSPCTEAEVSDIEQVRGFIANLLSFSDVKVVPMSALSDRIRRARLLCKRMSQQQLAVLTGVQRSAVAQWERKNGSLPSMSHLIAIANATGVCIEWLGTGRGPAKPGDNWTGVLSKEDIAQDEIETLCLVSLRRMPRRLREQMASLMELVARNCT